MQYKIKEIRYMQLFISQESSFKVSKFNSLSTENNFITFEILLKNKSFKVSLVTAESQHITFQLKQNDKFGDLLNLLSDFFRNRKQKVVREPKLEY